MENINEVLEELQKDVIETELIQDNCLQFLYNDVLYRVRMPNQKENSLANNYKNKIYITLLQQKTTLTIEQLTVLLKENNIDIEAMDKEAKELEDKMMQTYITLSNLKDNEVEAIEETKKQLEEIRNQRLVVVLKKAELLAPALQNQVQDEYYKFLTATCSEKSVNEDKWEPVWVSYDEYEKDASKLPYMILGKMSELMFGV